MTVGPAEQALVRGQRRLGADDAAATLEAFQERGFLAADIGAGADPDFEVEIVVGADDAFAEIAGAPGGRDRGIHRRHRMRIFRADVDVAFGRADGDAGDRHALDHDEGIALHDHAVGKGAAVAFVGVADDVFAVGAGLRHGLPLDAGRESCAAASAQSGRRDVGEDFVRGQRQRALQPLVAVMGAVVADRAGIDHAATRERQAVLPLQPWDFVREAEPQGVRAVARHRIEQGGDVRRGHGAVRDAAFHRRHLDHRLQPIKPARSVPDDLDREAALVRSLLERSNDIVGADGNRAGIARNENPHFHRCASATSASRRASSSRPTTRPSSIADGAVAHSPRQ